MLGRTSSLVVTQLQPTLVMSETTSEKTPRMHRREDANTNVDLMTVLSCPMMILRSNQQETAPSYLFNCVRNAQMNNGTLKKHCPTFLTACETPR